jgi:hypothetical protein
VRASAARVAWRRTRRLGSSVSPSEYDEDVDGEHCSQGVQRMRPGRILESRAKLLDEVIHVVHGDPPGKPERRPCPEYTLRHQRRSASLPRADATGCSGLLIAPPQMAAMPRLSRRAPGRVVLRLVSRRTTFWGKSGDMMPETTPIRVAVHAGEGTTRHGGLPRSWHFEWEGRPTSVAGLTRSGGRFRGPSPRRRGPGSPHRRT